MKVMMLSHTPDVEKLIASAAKLCYSSSDINELKNGLTEEKTESYINMLMSLGHESVMEHAYFTFGIEGISRACSHQLVRHRIASYSQKSQRYVNEALFKYVTPRTISRNSEATDIFCKMMIQIADCYEKLRDTITLDILQSSYPKVAREDLFDTANPNDVKVAREVAVEESWQR